MRSRRARALLGMDGLELLATRSFWLLLLVIGPLVGHAFITSVNLYAEASGGGGGPAALAQGVTPLDGIFVPTFGAYDLAITLLFPFVAISLVSSGKESGALGLLLQTPFGPAGILASKAAVLLLGWCVAFLPGLFAVALWLSYGGHVYWPELGGLLLGHLLRFFLACGVATAAAAIAGNAASAAIATLAVTLGSWVLDFMAAARGGLLEDAARYTPTAALRVFERGELSLSTVAVLISVGLGGLAVAAVWLHPGRARRTRARRSAAAALALAGATGAGALLKPSWDLSENRRNSFSLEDEAALSRIEAPLTVTVYLAAADPRLMDLTRGVLGKLLRSMRSVTVSYAARSRSGLFEGAGDHYGEVWYELDGKKAMVRSASPPVVLQAIYDLAGMNAPDHSAEKDDSGHPLAAKPAGAASCFFAAWPMLVVMAWGTTRYFFLEGNNRRRVPERSHS